VYKYVRILVIPIQDDKNDDWLNILFFQTEDSQNIKGTLAFSGDENEIIKRLNGELENTKTHLQNVIEELETSYEEMQSLNEELQSSNEELQSSNEELETTNEELQSTNEELQTAYSELRVLYDDKDKRTTQLEALMEKFNEKTKDLQNQRDLTEAIIDTAPIAITMVDKEGKIKFANSFALTLFGITKDESLKLHYDSTNWKIASFEGNAMPKEELPFSLIKKTYEAVYNILHTVEIKEKKLYLSVSGAPIFDPLGMFEGAVFCIENLTNQQAQKDDIDFYKKTLEDKRYATNSNRDKFLELIIYDIVANFKNDINELILILENKQNPNILEKLQNAITQSAKGLDSVIDFYTKKIYFERKNIIEELLYDFELFQTVFIENNIVVENKLHQQFDKRVNTIAGKELFYSIIDLAIFIQQECLKDGYKLIISNEMVGERIAIIITVEALEKECSEIIIPYLKEINSSFELISFELIQNTISIKL
jgi:PAS domain S-box-containing protein